MKAMSPLIPFTFTFHSAAWIAFGKKPERAFLDVYLPVLPQLGADRMSQPVEG